MSKYYVQLSGIASSSQMYNSVQYTSGLYILHSCAHNSRNGAQEKYVLHGTLASYIYYKDLVYIYLLYCKNTICDMVPGILIVL